MEAEIVNGYIGVMYLGVHLFEEVFGFWPGLGQGMVSYLSSGIDTENILAAVDYISKVQKLDQCIRKIRKLDNFGHAFDIIDNIINGVVCQIRKFFILSFFSSFAGLIFP